METQIISTEIPMVFFFTQNSQNLFCIPTVRLSATRHSEISDNFLTQTPKLTIKFGTTE